MKRAIAVHVLIAREADRLREIHAALVGVQRANLVKTSG